MSPAFNLHIDSAWFGGETVPAGRAARGTRAARRHGHFAPKFALDRRNFGAGKVGVV